MRKFVTVALFLCAMVDGVFADSWARPVESDYFSENGRFVAHVVPATSEAKAMMTVYKITAPNRVKIWKCSLGNEGAPQQVLLLDDGTHVVTVDENNNRVHGAMGDHALAFYNRDGILKNYSLEGILGYPGKMSDREFRRLVSQSVSGRYWASLKFLLKHDGNHLFAAWLRKGHRWLAWDVMSGSEIEVDANIGVSCDKKARQWAINKLINPDKFGYAYASAAETLGRLRRPEDQQYVESLLKSKRFRTWYQHDHKRFVRYYSYSEKRNTAEKTLAAWDDRIFNRSKFPSLPYSYLGTIEGSIILPRAPKPEDEDFLCIMLVPDTANEEQWYLEDLHQRLCVRFGKYHMHNDEWPGSQIPFSFCGITPGRYRIKAVWDKARPNTFRGEGITGSPSKGDYENQTVPLVCVNAGEVVKHVVIDCTHEVGDASVSLWGTNRLSQSPTVTELCPCGKEHSEQRVCVVFNSPMPIKSFHHGPYHNYAGASLRQDGDTKIYTYNLAKECNDLSQPEGEAFDISIEMTLVKDRLTRVTVEGPYFSAVQFKTFLKALSIDAKILGTDKIESWMTIHGEPMSQISLDYTLTQVMRILGRPSTIEGNQVIYNYKRANNGSFRITFNTTKDGRFMSYRTDLGGGLSIVDLSY